MSSFLQLFNKNKPKGVSFPEPPSSSKPTERPPVRATHIDFPAYNLPEYANRTAFVIDNLFTLDDCARLLAAAESKSEWVPAKLNAGGDKEYSDTSYRNSARILHDDDELAQWILEKLEPYLSEIEFIEGANRHAMIKGRRGIRVKTSARLLRLNERLRFLRYGPGEFFKPHTDGSYVTPDKKQVSYYTLQVYLNGDKESLKGGATRFWPRGYNIWSSSTKAKKSIHYVDIESRTGRVLIFEHEGLMHSGEEVIKGVKYSLRTDLMYVENEDDSQAERNNVSS
jgi:hypothetical protein